MFEQLLGLVKLEQLLFFFKEQSLSSSGLTGGSWQISRDPPVNPGDDCAVKSLNDVVKISDSDLLKQILPQEISDQMFRKGNLTLLAFVFALRHKLTILNILFHISARLHKEQGEEFLESLDTSLNFKISKLFYEYKNLLQPDFWGKSNQLPVIGFSAVGCLFSLQSINLCRAFDHYEIIHCKNEITSQNVTKNIFCDTHHKEIFWENEFSKEASTQAKMFRFYLEKNNFNEFDEINLQKMLNNFFYKYTNYKNDFSKKMKNESPEKIKILLEFYGFLNVDELKQLGVEVLRRRFLEKAKQLHPDVGGTQDLFREARNYYEQLRGLL